jgi:NADH dehydrogenase
MFIPFYFPRPGQLRVVIVGGGYSGLAALAGIREFRPDAEIVLIDPRSHHLKITHLHETFRRPLADFQVAFSALERRFGLRHIQASLQFDDELLTQWQANRYLTVNDEDIEFDYLLIATGAGSRTLEKNEQTLDLADFTRRSGAELLREHLGETGGQTRHVSVVGAGATGIQFLFEMALYLRTLPFTTHLRLINSDKAVLKQFNPDLARYVEARMSDLGIEHVDSHLYRKQADNLICIEQAETGDVRELPSDLTVLFLGKSPIPALYANQFGQVTVNGQSLDRVFASGDGSHYRAPGSNALTAQSAVRKGKLVARNILRHCSAFPMLEPYLHRDLGYVINLGPTDAVGWLAMERNIVGGLPAAVIKELVEAQYDLLLAGIDTYLI